MILEDGWGLGISPDEANALLEEGEAWARAHCDMRALAAKGSFFCARCKTRLGGPSRTKTLATVDGGTFDDTFWIAPAPGRSEARDHPAAPLRASVGRLARRGAEGGNPIEMPNGSVVHLTNGVWTGRAIAASRASA